MSTPREGGRRWCRPDAGHVVLVIFLILALRRIPLSTQLLFDSIVDTSSSASPMPLIEATEESEPVQQGGKERHIATEGARISPSPRKVLEGTLDCLEHLRDGRTGTKFDDPNKGKLLGRFTVTEPPFYVSLHVKEYDQVRYGTLDWGKYYEKKLTQAFTDVLQSSPPGSRVIDVGGNIGWFTLVSMASGASVDVFEPNPANILRLCESICLNGWEQCSQPSSMMSEGNRPLPSYRVHPIGLMDRPGKFQLVTNGVSPGASKISKFQSSTRKSVEVTVETLDGLADRLGWNKDEVAILKVDVESNEHNVIMGGKKLIQSNRVRNIFTEGNVGSRKDVVKFCELVKFMVDARYFVYKMGGSMGPNNEFEFRPDENYTDRVLWGCSGYDGRKRKQCNMWWKLAADVDTIADNSTSSGQ